MSLSREPAFTLLKQHFVCGYRDIQNKGWAGASGKHMPDGQSIHTSNGAGPHNIQIFVMNPDGTILTCLPGYWHPEDLARELELAMELNRVWTDASLSTPEKNEMFRKMQLAHLAEHPKETKARSHLQGFDLQFEKDRLVKSDAFYHHRIDPRTRQIPKSAIKTTDVIMHERMAQRPFQNYSKFDVVAFSDYGRPMYDKHEDFRTADGNIQPHADLGSAPLIGNDPRAHPIKTEVKRQGKQIVRQTFNSLVRQGIRAALN